MELCVVNTKEMDVYCFTSEDKKEYDLSRANKSRLEDIATWESHCKKYQDREDLRNYLLSDQNTHYEIMTFDEFLALERNKLLGGEVAEISEDDFQDALNSYIKLVVSIRKFHHFFLQRLYRFHIHIYRLQKELLK